MSHTQTHAAQWEYILRKVLLGDCVILRRGEHTHKPRWSSLPYAWAAWDSLLLRGRKLVQCATIQNSVRLKQAQERMMQSRDVGINTRARLC